MTTTATRLKATNDPLQAGRMIITHTKTALRETRVYLGAHSSFEVYITPHADRVGWSLHSEVSPTGSRLTESEMKECVRHVLCELSAELGVAPADLFDTPFIRIMALHTADSFQGRRAPATRRPNMDYAFVATPPNMSRPSVYTPNDASRRRSL